MSRILCKLRCMSRRYNIDGVTYRFLAVKEDGDPENTLFWKFTPYGELSMSYPTPDDPGFEPGAVFYVELAELEDFETPSEAWKSKLVWRISEIYITGLAARMYTLKRDASRWNSSPAPHDGTFRFSVDNSGAIGVMAEKIFSYWSLTIRPV